MNNLQPFLEELFTKESLIRLRLLGPREQRGELPNRIEARPLKRRGERAFQFAFYQGKRVTQRNLPADEATELALELLPEFKQVDVFTLEADYRITLDRKQQATIHRLPPSMRPPSDKGTDQKSSHEDSQPLEDQ